MQPPSTPHAAQRLPPPLRWLLVLWLVVTVGALMLADGGSSWWTQDPRWLWLMPQALVVFFVLVVFASAWGEQRRAPPTGEEDPGSKAAR